jgi:hypothetical protein
MNLLRFALHAGAVALGIWASAASADPPSHPLVQVLTPTNAEVSNGAAAPPNAYFGAAVAVYKSMALVGMPRTSTGSTYETGRVGVFTRKTDGTWQRTGTFISPAPRSGGHFGRLLALENDGAIVADETTLYVFRYTSSTGWKIVQWVKPPKSDVGAGFSSALDFRCNTVAASATSTSNRFVYLYDRLSDGRLSFKARLTSPAGSTTAEFGASVAVNCDLAVVGAPDSTYKTTDPGSAFVYRRVDGTWRRVQQLVPGDGAAGDRFGSAVAINQQTIFVGSPSNLVDRPDPETGQGGSAYIFSFTSGGYAESDKLHPSSAESSNYEGFGEGLRATDTGLFVEASSIVGEGLRADYLIFTYTRSGGTTTPLGSARDSSEGGGFFATSTRLFVGVPADQRCFECVGQVNIYDITRTE